MHERGVYGAEMLLSVGRVIQRDLDEIRNRINLDALSGMNVVITGGAGFLESWIADSISPYVDSLLIIDNLSTGSISNVAHLLRNPKVKFIMADVVDYEIRKKVGSVIDISDIDIIFHLAARAGPEDFMKHPVETALVNSIGTYNMLKLALESDALFLFSSSSEVYGIPFKTPIPEDFWGYVNPIGLRSAYDESKRFSEALIMAFHREYGLKVCVARIFNSYGPRLAGRVIHGRVVNRFIELCLENKPVTIHGSGTQTRCFTYVTDTIVGILRMVTTSRAIGEVFNIGSTEEVSILELAQLVIKLTNSKSCIVFAQPRSDDPPRRVPDITKARRILKWEPSVRLVDGLNRTIAWYKERYLT